MSSISRFDARREPSWVMSSTRPKRFSCCLPTPGAAPGAGTLPGVDRPSVHWDVHASPRQVLCVQVDPRDPLGRPRSRSGPLCTDRSPVIGISMHVSHHITSPFRPNLHTFSRLPTDLKESLIWLVSRDVSASAFFCRNFFWTLMNM